MKFFLIIFIFLSHYIAAQNKVTLNLPGGAGSAGGVSVVSVVDANGFEGTVATPATTPAITIKTDQTGLLYGNGTSVTGTKLGNNFTRASDSLYMLVWANVLDYGAVGDGTTNNTAAFQAAVNTGLPVFVPHGTFLISTTVTMENNQTMFGMDWQSIIKITANTRAIAVDSGCVVSGLKFIGNGKAGSGAFNTGIIISGAVGGSIDNCMFQDFAGDPVANGGGGVFGSSIHSANSDGWRITNNYFYNNDAGLNLSTRGEYVSVTANSFGANTCALLGAAGNLSIVGNIIQNNTTGFKCINVTNNSHSTISSNLINHNVYPIWIEDVAFSSGFSFNDNMIFFGGIYIKNANNIKFSNNQFQSLDSVYLDNSYFLTRIGGWWGQTTAPGVIPINRYNGAEDFAVIGETRYSAAVGNYWIKQATTDTVSFAGPLLIATKTPSSATDSGTTGQIAWDGAYFYMCTATNTWRRVAHATW